MINFCFDQVLDTHNKIVVPNLSGLGPDTTVAQLEACRHDLTVRFPYCDYPRLLDYACDEGVDFAVHTVEQAPPGSFYFVNINFFVTDLDYLARLPLPTLRRLQQGQIRMLFYYCEADTADRLSQRLADLCVAHQVPVEQVYFISHNTRAQQFARWFYFNDDEILYNRTCHRFLAEHDVGWRDYPRRHKTTALVRTHKNWRAVFSGQLLKAGWPSHSLFSYCANDNRDPQDLLDCALKPELNKLNPRQTQDPHNTWLADAQRLLSLAPIEIDHLDNSERTRYRTFVPEFFYDSYWNIVIETHMDIENLPGVFITEKTWKPIAHYQPFVIMGCPGSLAHLRDMGYRTFGDHIDESYDQIQDHVQRTHRVLEVCHWLASRSLSELHQLHEQIRPILEHNRELLWSSKRARIQHLFAALTAHG